jgi:hypothetical protein
LQQTSAWVPSIAPSNRIHELIWRRDAQALSRVTAATVAIGCLSRLACARLGRVSNRVVQRERVGEVAEGTTSCQALRARRWRSISHQAAALRRIHHALLWPTPTSSTCSKDLLPEYELVRLVFQFKAYLDCCLWVATSPVRPLLAHVWVGITA